MKAVIDLKTEQEFTSRNIHIGQVLHIGDIFWIVLMIGVKWETKEDGSERIVPDRDNAVIVLYDEEQDMIDDDGGENAQFANLYLHHTTQDILPSQSSSSEEVPGETPDHISGDQTSDPAYSRTYLQNLLFEHHHHLDVDPLVGQEGDIFYLEKDLEKICDLMHKYLQEQIAEKNDTIPHRSQEAWNRLWFLMGQDALLSEMKLFFSHKA